MANRVSFIIQLKDQFGRTAQKINRNFANIKRSSDKASLSVVAFARKAKASFADMGKTMLKTGAIMTAAITVPVALMGKAMIKSASDATETANKFNAVFDDVESKANKVADSFAKSFGTAGSTARKLIGDTGDLLVGFGFSGDAALELSQKVNELAADLTSFQNIEGGIEAASAALTKALLGETESAKSLGIVIRQLTPEFKEQVALIQRMQGVTEQQAKAIAILNVATKQSRKAIGDVSRTWDDYASVVRRSSEASKEMSESFGMLLIPFATKLMLALTGVVKWMNNLSSPMKTFILGITAIVAIGGPLLLLLGGIALAMTAITLPMLGISLGILAIIVAVGFLIANIDTIGEAFSNVWDSVKAGIRNMVNFGIKWINLLLAPMNFVLGALGFGTFNIDEIQAPSAPSSSVSGSLTGEIVVSASPGAVVKSTSMTSRSSGLAIGLNMAAL